MATVLKVGLMAHVTKALSNTGKSTEQERLNGRTTACLSVSSTIITSTAKECIFGATAENTKAIGKLTRCTAAELLVGVTVAAIWVSISTTEKTVTENSCGQTAGPIRATGLMENNTVKVCIRLHRDSKSLENGEKANALDG